MKRIYTNATILSAVLLATQLAVGVWAISPRSRQSVCVCDGFWFSLWGSNEAMVGPLMFFSDDEANTLRPVITTVGGVAPREGESLGVYYWYLPLGDDESVWTVMISVWYPVILCAVLPTVGLVRAIVRRRCRYSIRTGMVCLTLIACVLGLWSLTEQVGTRAVLRQLDMRYREEGSNSVERNPRDDDELLNSLRPEWHYLGNATAPLPFLVAYDEARGIISPYTGNYLGSGTRGYCLWLLGIKIPLEYWQRLTWGFT